MMIIPIKIKYLALLDVAYLLDTYSNRGGWHVWNDCITFELYYLFFNDKKLQENISAGNS